MPAGKARLRHRRGAGGARVVGRGVDPRFAPGNHRRGGRRNFLRRRFGGVTNLPLAGSNVGRSVNRITIAGECWRGIFIAKIEGQILAGGRGFIAPVEAAIQNRIGITLGGRRLRLWVGDVVVVS
ncbi:MAG: hypothetical protein ACREQB_08025, partial [Candidatus Binataceae bacterium]